LGHNIKHPIPVRVTWESFEHEHSGYQKLWQLEEWGSKACFSGETCASQVIVVSKNASQAWLLWLHLDLWPASISQSFCCHMTLTIPPSSKIWLGASTKECPPSVSSMTPSRRLRLTKDRSWGLTILLPPSDNTLFPPIAAT
jgi:hypothetical protein